MHTLAMSAYPKRLHYSHLLARICEACPRNRWPFPLVSSLRWVNRSKSARSGQRMSWSNTRHFLVFRLSAICRVSACMISQGSVLMCPGHGTSSDRLCTPALYRQKWFIYNTVWNPIPNPFSLKNQGSGPRQKWFIYKAKAFSPIFWHA
jgi:hypothetical protein